MGSVPAGTSATHRPGSPSTSTPTPSAPRGGSPGRGGAARCRPTRTTRPSTRRSKSLKRSKIDKSQSHHEPTHAGQSHRHHLERRSERALGTIRFVLLVIRVLALRTRSDSMDTPVRARIDQATKGYVAVVGGTREQVSAGSAKHNPRIQLGAARGQWWRPRRRRRRLDR